MVTENLILVAVFFVVLILLSKIFARIMGLSAAEVNCYRLMMIFPNLGFMGIPLVRSLYGEEAVIFVAFYIVGYNLLVYSYGILLAMGNAPAADGQIGGFVSMLGKIIRYMNGNPFAFLN